MRLDSIVGRAIQLTKDYTTGNETFKQGSRGTVIEAASRKDRKLKVKLDNDTKKYRLIEGCDLQLYEGVAFFLIFTSFFVLCQGIKLVSSYPSQAIRYS